MKSKTIIDTISPEQLKNKYFKADNGMDFSKPNFSLFFAQTVEGTCKFLNLPTPPHRNTAHELILLTKGSIKRTMGIDKFEVLEGNVFFLPASQITTIETISENAKGFYCHFDASMLIRKFINLHLINEFDFLRTVSNPVISLPRKTVSILIQLFNRIVEENQNGNNQDLIQSYLLTILLEIKRHYEPKKIKNISPANYLTDRFKDLITTNFKENHLVADYAEILNVTPNHLNKSVKSVTGKSPTLWINELMMLEAKVLLYQSRLSISEIAYELGLEDPSYFGRMFKKHVGSTPSNFRKKMENPL